MRTTVSRALRVLVATVAGLMVLAVLALPAQAETTYTVRVFGGNEGVVAGQGDKGYAEKTVAAGESIKLSESFPVTINDPDTYYQRGYRKSGKDNLVGAADYISSVTEDMDFVVSYGAKGTRATYTIRFVEYGTGRALTDEQGRTEVTYEGNVGDKPVVAYSYIPGYRPLYNNVTGTLKEGSNVWELPYAAIEQNVTVNNGGTTTTTNPTTTTTTVTNQGGTTSGEGTEGGGTAADGEGTADATDQTDDGAATGADATTPPETEEILDMDNPLAGGATGTNDELIDDNGAAGGNAASAFLRVHPLAATIAALVAAAIVILLFFFFKKKRDGEEEEHE